MIEVELDSASLARVAVRPSPVHEILGWLRSARLGERHPVLGRPPASTRRLVADPDVALVATMISGSGYRPDFLTPRAPALQAQRPADLEDVEVQLSQVESAPADKVCEQVELWLGGEPVDAGPVRSAADDGTLARRTAAGLARFRDEAMAGWWGDLQGLLRDEVTRVSRSAARFGMGAVFAGIHPQVSWDGALLRIDMPYAERVRFVDQELVLSPSVTQWSHLLAQVCGDDASLVYPTSRAVRSPRDASALAELLGRTRASILRDLAVERTPTDLATRHCLAKPTVSHHLGVLVRTGLVYREPEGKQIHYGLTSRGRSLVNG